MSGGVDSAVAALILMEQGYEVVGVNLRTWDYETVACNTTKKSCCSPKDIQDARDTGLQLNIPFYVVRIEKAFKEKVMDRFVLDYSTGRTPNPCVECNTFVKFGVLFEKARALGIDRIATGHYARIYSGDRMAIRGGKDLKKNQAYYLYGLSQESIARTIFPLGDMEKHEVREIARKHNMVVADKEESQEICFVPENDYRSFLRRQGLEFQPGYFRDTSGRILGKHQGKEQFTVGQRKGLGISWSQPLYVVRIEDNGDVIVATDQENPRQFFVEQTSFQALAPAALNNDQLVECRVQIRYRARPVPCTIRRASISEEISWNGAPTGTIVEVNLSEDAGAVTPGQSAVFFAPENHPSMPEDVVLGGGFIQK
ncbi:MAG: tRNA 2-thiouridine(34) synthase MnmA [Leptospirales bacterium]|nr:tRNA 2-thiouridine(34) synthase MnmA [Leptospirales bacterium]